MAAGDFENQQAFEYTVRLNVKTIEGYSTDTRKIVRELEGKVKELKNMMVAKDDIIQQMKSQISSIQAMLYKNGTQ